MVNNTGLNKSVKIYDHKKKKNRTIREITLSKSNRTKMTSDTVKQLCDKYQKSLSDSKIMVKVLTNQGWITLKGYDDDSSVILSEEEYLGAREKKNLPQIYKVSFFIIMKK